MVLFSELTILIHNIAEIYENYLKGNRPNQFGTSTKETKESIQYSELEKLIGEIGC